MMRTVWMRRATAGAAVGLIVMSTASAIAIGLDLRAVSEAQAQAQAPVAIAHESPPPTLVGLKPLLRSNAPSPDVAIGEFLNGALGQTGLVLASARTVSVRPLGGGLRLAEVRVEGHGDLSTAGAISSWVAVNRVAVRLKSMTATSGPQGEASISMVMLMVIA